MNGLYCHVRHLAVACFALHGLLFTPVTSAGTSVFAEVIGKNVITHPANYIGFGSTVTVRVCIVPGTPNAMKMETPIQNNINIFNALQATTGNLSMGGANNIPGGQIDFESVALHEMGHCLGLGHVNLASESNLTGNDQNYTKSLEGLNTVFDINAGADGIIGSADDVRGDDVNLHWFRKSNNNPFTIAATVDSSTYSRNQGDLPAGHNFAANGDRTVANLLGVANTEAVMQQLTFTDEAQRTLIHDDVATLRLAASGIDETAATSDDYTINIIYVGISAHPNCDINISFNNAETGFAQCNLGATQISLDHWRITSADIYFDDTYSWFFNTDPVNQTDTDGDGLHFVTEQANGTDPNLVDSDGDGLVDGAGGIVCVSSGPGCVAVYPAGVDADGDGFVDGEIDAETNALQSDTDGDQLSDGIEVSLGSDPLDPASWPAIADGDLAPLGNPDGTINAADVLIALRIVLGNVTVSPLQLAHGDLYPPGTPDGVIDLSDALLLQKLVLGLP